MPLPLDSARRLALEAGALIVSAIDQTKRIDHKSAVNLVTDTDHQAEALIMDGLRNDFPDHAIVAEETAAGRPPEGPCWYVDPVDGTVNFVHGIPHCSVSIALLDDGHPSAAVVYDPCKNELFEAERGGGTCLNGQPLAVSGAAALGDSLMVTGFPYDRRENPDRYLSFFKAFMVTARDIRRFGSAALDLAYIAAGRFDGFWEFKLEPWDTAAGWLLVEEAGGVVSDMDGAAFDPWSKRILASNGTIHQECVDLLSELRAEQGSS